MKHLFTCSMVLAGALLFGGCDTKVRNSTQDTVVINERELNGRIEEALIKDPAYKFPEVKVQTAGNTIQLSGFVETGQQKDRAGEIAKMLGGNLNVENKITVKK